MALDTRVVPAKPLEARADLLAVFVREGKPGADPRVAALDRALDGLVLRAAQDEEFTGKESALLALHTHGKIGAQRVALIGLGREKDEGRTLDQLRSAASRAVRHARAAGAKSLAVSWPASSGEREAQALAEGATLGAYSFDRYKKEKRPLKLARVSLLVAQKPPRALEEAVRLGCQIRKRGMNLFLGVAQGSAEEPQLVRLSYDPKRARGAPVALVGKAITFDSGGLSLKTAQGMEDMKTDMAGAAAVISAMRLVAALEPPFPVRGYFGACENLPSGTAYKPGDVIVGKNGTSVEVLNTDAEGRLVLADVLAWAVEEKPAAVIDVATLTGAILVALGPWTAGLFSNDEKLAGELSAAARQAGEAVWRMPLPAEMEELIKSPVADLQTQQLISDKK